MLNKLNKIDDSIIDHLEKLSIQVSLLSHFSDCYLNLDKNHIVYRKINRYEPSNDVSVVLTSKAKGYREIVALLKFLRSSDVTSYNADNVFDGVSYDLSYKFEGKTDSRVIMFCPEISEDPITKKLYELIENVLIKLEAY